MRPRRGRWSRAEGCAAARAAGAEILHAPGQHPEYHPGYYGVFFRDPDGNNVEAVFHAPADIVAES